MTTPDSSSFDDLAVSRVRGRWQVPALTWTTQIVLVAAVIGLAVPGDVGRAIQIAVVAAITAVPLLRVVWLTGRWASEHDGRFVALGVALLAVVGAGAILALL